MNNYREPFGIPMDQVVFRLHDSGGRWGGLFACISLSVWFLLDLSSSLVLSWGIKKIPCSNSIRVSLKCILSV